MLKVTQWISGEATVLAQSFCSDATLPSAAF